MKIANYLRIEAAGMKEELFQLANQVDSKGDGMFSGLSGAKGSF